jgi:hypothetical protein
MGGGPYEKKKKKKKEVVKIEPWQPQKIKMQIT